MQAATWQGNIEAAMDEAHSLRRRHDTAEAAFCPHLLRQAGANFKPGHKAKKDFLLEGDSGEVRKAFVAREK